MEDTRVFAINPDYKEEKFDNEILLYSVFSGKGVYLNETAYLVWQMCGKGLTVKEIIALLEEEYHSQLDVIRDDVLQTIDALVDEGVIVAADD